LLAAKKVRFVRVFVKTRSIILPNLERLSGVIRKIPHRLLLKTILGYASSWLITISPAVIAPKVIESPESSTDAGTEAVQELVAMIMSQCPTAATTPTSADISVTPKPTVERPE